MTYPRHGLWALLGSTLLARSPEAYTCEVVTRESTTNYGSGITASDHEGVTPFALGQYNAAIAFDEEHCIEMCCEQVKCYVAVYDHTESVCYLKGVGATHSNDYKAMNGFTSYDMLFRGGSSKPLAMEPTECNSKKGLAFDFKDPDDLDALALGMSWWYNWSPGVIEQEVKVAQASSGCEYIPMIWSDKDLEHLGLTELDALGKSSHLLGFNEPNFESQANLTPQKAASLWSLVADEAATLGAELVSPAVNFCAGSCNMEDPIRWLDEFFAACEGIVGGCRVTAIAVHSFTCEAKYLNKILHGYLKYNLPLWLTEFACADDSSFMSVQGQANYLAESLLLLELHPSIARYAWFTGRGGNKKGVTGCDLLSGTGELTEVGSVFFETYKNLQRCETYSSSIGTSSPISTSTNPSTSEIDGSMDLMDVDPTAEKITDVVISNLGGTGTYQEVVNMVPGENMVCPEPDDTCVQKELEVSGPLSPFDEGVTVVFRGPMNLHNIVWFEGTASSLTKTSTWTPSNSNNLVFMNNLGGNSGCSGVWTICGGNSQSFSSKDGKNCSTKPEQFNGVLGGDVEVNIMTSTECTDASSCGFFRETGMEGWAGGADGTKVIVFEVDMPHCDTEGDDCDKNRPAVWALNSKVVRTKQYGCNCRGVGGNGGCGEFDMLEAVIGGSYSDMLFTTVYDFKGTGSPGPGKYFLRPSAPTIFAAVFRGGEDAYLQVVQLTEFNFTQGTLSGSVLDSLKAVSVEEYEIYLSD